MMIVTNLVDNVRQALLEGTHDPVNKQIQFKTGAPRIANLVVPYSYLSHRIDYLEYASKSCW